MTYLLALGSAALYGGADFLGGLASRQVTTVATVFMSQAAGLALLRCVVPFLGAAPGHADLLWGGVAGVAGGIGVALLYRALAIGTMGVVAPTTAVCAVMIPVLAEVLRGERLALRTTAGILLALLAIALVSQSNPSAIEGGSVPSATGGPGTLRVPAVSLALASGVAIGVFFLALARTDAAAGLWPLVAARAVSVCLFASVALFTRDTLRIAVSSLPIVVGCGVLDMAANAFYLIATRSGTLSVVVTLSSLYPASTVALARVVLHERLTGRQVVGIATALVAVVLIVSSGV